MMVNFSTSSLAQWRTLFAAPSVPILYKSAQAADAEQMDRAVQKLLSDVAALNAAIAVAIPGDPEVLLTPIDWNLAGAGDGHTFIFTITFIPQAFKGGNEFDGATYGFVTAATAADLDVVLNAKMNATLSTVVPPPPADPTSANVFWNQVVGGAKGARMMAGFGLVHQGGG